MPGPVGSLDSDFGYATLTITFDVPALGTDESGYIAVVSRDVASPRGISGVPGDFGSPIVSEQGSENRVFLYHAVGPRSAETVTLTATSAMQWGGAGFAFDLPLAAYAINPDPTDFGGEPPFDMTTPSVNPPPGSAVWVQIILTTSFSRFLTPATGVTRLGYMESGSYVGLAVAYKAVTGGVGTGTSATWKAGDTDGADDNGTEYLGVSLALGIDDGSGVGGGGELPIVTPLDAAATITATKAAALTTAIRLVSGATITGTTTGALTIQDRLAAAALAALTGSASLTTSVRLAGALTGTLNGTVNPTFPSYTFINANGTITAAASNTLVGRALLSAAPSGSVYGEADLTKPVPLAASGVIEASAMASFGATYSASIRASHRAQNIVFTVR